MRFFGDEKKRLNRTVPNQLDKYEARHGKDSQNGITEKSVRQKDGSMKNTSSATYTHHQLHSVIQQTPELGHVRKNHPAIYPLKLPGEYIKALTNKGDRVFDPFLGSGTTLIAADQLNRICYGVEIEPKYCHVIIERYRNHCEKVGKDCVVKVNGTKI